MELSWPHWLVLGYLGFVNLWGLVLCAGDKQRAIQKKRRIPEADFFRLAVFLGGPGVWVGMYIFRHKTLHKSFVWGIPAITLVMYGGLWLFSRWLASSGLLG